jgi:hypothetical protein
MIETIPLWYSFSLFLLLQGTVLLVTGWPLYTARRRGEVMDAETRRAFRNTNLTTAAVFLILFDAVGVLRLLNIDPMLILVRGIVMITDLMRGL